MLLAYAALAFLLGALLSAAVTPRVIKAAKSLALLDAPERGRHVHKEAVPRIGGVAVILGALTALIMTEAVSEVYDLDRSMYAALVAATILFIVGLYDDLRGVSPKVKILAQLFGGVLVWYAGFQPETIRFPLGFEVQFGGFALFVFLAWVVVITNAYNLIDGINGLAGGVGVVASIAVASVALVNQRPHGLFTLMALAGALLGFLRYNYPRARIFLGDSGSMPVGFLLAYLALRGARTPDNIVLGLIPLTALGLPIVDTCLAIVRRWLRGTPLSGGDARHIHHRLLSLGFTHARATAILVTLASGFAMLGVIVTLLPSGYTWGALVIGAAASLALLIFGSSILSYHEFSVASKVILSGPARARRVIRDEIHAVDVAEAVRTARSLDDVERILAGTAAGFGFLHMELYKERAGSGHRLRHSVERFFQATRAWKLEYHLHAHDHGPSLGSLVIWCDAKSGADLQGAERVAKALAPALEVWLEQRGGLKTGEYRSQAEA